MSTHTDPKGQSLDVLHTDWPHSNVTPQASTQLEFSSVVWRHRPQVPQLHCGQIAGMVMVVVVEEEVLVDVEVLVEVVVVAHDRPSWH
jgi:hypothetical protein